MGKNSLVEYLCEYHYKAGKGECPDCVEEERYFKLDEEQQRKKNVSS